MTDPIADMLTRIRNAVGAKHTRVDMPASRIKADIARIMTAGSSRPADPNAPKLLDNLAQFRFYSGCLAAVLRRS